MPALYVIGRILFAALFLVSGINKFLDLQSAAQAIGAHFAVPAQLTDYTSQIETFTGMPITQVIAILGGAIEILGALAIATNLGARTFAVLLALLLVLTVFYFNDFWNAAATERTASLFEALKNLALIGALLMIAGRPRELAASGSSYTDI
ncbi:MAG: DoxX family membrane protein [Afipia sp.]|nr:DoxX family membrane protein [Afipia sp.]